MKKLLKIVLCLTLLATIGGCTANQRAKDWGGKQIIDIPSGQKVICATWKNDNLWYLTRPRHENEKPEVFTLKESSSYGVMEGTVSLIEH